MLVAGGSFVLTCNVTVATAYLCFAMVLGIPVVIAAGCCSASAAARGYLIGALIPALAAMLLYLCTLGLRAGSVNIDTVSEMVAFRLKWAQRTCNREIIGLLWLLIPVVSIVCGAACRARRTGAMGSSAAAEKSAESFGHGQPRDTVKETRLWQFSLRSLFLGIALVAVGIVAVVGEVNTASDWLCLAMTLGLPALLAAGWHGAAPRFRSYWIGALFPAAAAVVVYMCMITLFDKPPPADQTAWKIVAGRLRILHGFQREVIGLMWLSIPFFGVMGGMSSRLFSAG